MSRSPAGGSFRWACLAALLAGWMAAVGMACSRSVIRSDFAEAVVRENLAGAAQAGESEIPGMTAVVASSATSTPGADSRMAMPTFTPDAACTRPGWFPTGFGLKDHHIFQYHGAYYLISIYQSESSPFEEGRFVYARSTDLCTWERLGDVLATRTPGAADEYRIWAPYVFLEGGVYYLYYTGVTQKYTQRILLATTRDPANPASWQPQGVVFQPNHAGMNWQAEGWADCRDATVMKVEQTYYLYYTGMDAGGGIIGLATASAPSGPWNDLGSQLLPSASYVPESPTLARYGEAYYLFYHRAPVDAVYHIGTGPAGPWSEPQALQPGWAHEVWADAAGEWYTSYLTDYHVSIDRLTWNPIGGVARPWIGNLYPQLLPLVIR